MSFVFSDSGFDELYLLRAGIVCSANPPLRISGIEVRRWRRHRRRASLGLQALRSKIRVVLLGNGKIEQPKQNPQATHLGSERQLGRPEGWHAARSWTSQHT